MDAPLPEPLGDYDPDTKVLKLGTTVPVEGPVPGLGAVEASKVEAAGLRSEGPRAGDYFTEAGISKVFETPNDEGLVGKWLVNIVYTNDTGIVDKESESHKKFLTMPIAEFYSLDTDQFVDAYYIDTLLEHPPTSGLDLHGGEPVWTIDGKYMPEIISWLRSVNNRRTMGAVEAAVDDAWGCGDCGWTGDRMELVETCPSCDSDNLGFSEKKSPDTGMYESVFNCGDCGWEGSPDDIETRCPSCDSDNLGITPE